METINRREVINHECTNGTAGGQGPAGQEYESGCQNTQRALECSVSRLPVHRSWLLGFLILQLWPIIQSFYLSFTEYSLLEPARWIGLENYQDIAHDRLFFNSLKVTFLYVIASVPLKLLVALAVALLLNRNIRGISFYRTIIYLPSLIGGSLAVAVLWRNIFGLNGFINELVIWVGIAPKIGSGPLLPPSAP